MCTINRCRLSPFYLSHIYRLSPFYLSNIYRLSPFYLSHIFRLFPFYLSHSYRLSPFYLSHSYRLSPYGTKNISVSERCNIVTNTYSVSTVKLLNKNLCELGTVTAVILCPPKRQVIKRIILSNHNLRITF